MYYKVIAKCGHVKNRKYIEVPFAVYAESKKEAANYILKRSKVKKQLKNAISSVEEITYDEYLSLLDNNRNDSYIRAYCKQDVTNIDYPIVEMEQRKEYKRCFEFETRKDRIKYLMKKELIRWGYCDFKK